MKEVTYDVITFGEGMIRLSAPDHMRLEQAPYLEMSVSGAELNVAVNCARLGLRTVWVSRLVDNWTGHLIRNKGLEHGVDMSYIIWTRFDGVGLERNGFYHVERGIGPRAGTVIYDRGHSAISHIRPGEVDWAFIFQVSRWFHTSGITPALSDSAAQVTLEALQAAQQAGVTTSYDLNYRSNLWGLEKAQEVTRQLMPYICVLMGNEEEFEKALGLRVKAGSKDYGEIDPEDYKEAVREVVELYPNVEVIGITLRVARTGLLNDWQALLFDGQGFYLSQVYRNLEIEDRIGGGDSFSAGLIYSLLKGKNSQAAVDFAAAYSALAHTFPGDFNWATEEEVERAIGGSPIRIRR